MIATVKRNFGFSDQSIDENRKDVGVPSSTTSVLIQQSLEPLTIHEKEIHHEQKATINQTIEHHFQQNLDLNPEKSVPVAYVLNGVNGKQASILYNDENVQLVLSDAISIGRL